MRIEQIKLSQTGKERLTQLKRRTGLKNWNVLCRWAYCRSLAEPTTPSPVPIPADSSVEMDWKTFAGAHGAVYLALLKQRCAQNGIELDEAGGELNRQFRLHLHRGLDYLAGDKQLQSIEDLVAYVCPR
jgi:DNA sulfur modification protein DndE